jgi:iron complex transport system ATP-binding protein
MTTLALEHVGLEIDGRQIIQDASLTLSSGRSTAFIGPNGAGKSSLLRLLAGLWQPTEGLVTLNGSQLSQFQRRLLAQQIAFVPQNTDINFAFSVKDIVMMGRNPHLGRFVSENIYDHQCVEQAMLKTDVFHLANRPVTELSGGERQRVVIARSLATLAPIILLDEPTANLDMAHTLEILDLLKNLSQMGQTIAFSMHDINTAIRYAEQLVLVNQGRIVDIGLPEDVLTDTVMNKVFGVKIEKILTSTGQRFFYVSL